MNGRWSEEELERVARAALTLHAVELEVLLLSAQDRLSNDEIARQLGLSRKAVERHLAKAVHRLAWPGEDERRSWWKFW